MRIIFMGRKNYAAEMLKWTAEQNIDIAFVCAKPLSPLALAAEALDIPVIELCNAENFVRENPDKIDLVVSYLFPRKILEPLISAPRFGCINFHPSILPDWRGCAGYNAAILNKLSEWGASAHYVDEKIDTGAIIRVYKFNFDYRLETAYSLERKTQRVMMDLYKSIILDVLEQGRLKAVRQDTNEGTYISRKKMLQMMELDINNLEHEDLDLKIRAFWFPPYDGAGFRVNGKYYTVTLGQSFAITCALW